MKEKLLSGRYFLTVVVGLAFIWCVYTKALPPAAIAAIIISVYKDYFNRGDRTNGGGRNEVTKISNN